MYRLKTLLRPMEEGFASAYLRELGNGIYELTGTGLMQYLSNDARHMEDSTNNQGKDFQAKSFIFFLFFTINV